MTESSRLRGVAGPGVDLADVRPALLEATAGAAAAFLLAGGIFGVCFDSLACTLSSVLCPLSLGFYFLFIATLWFCGF